MDTSVVWNFQIFIYNNSSTFSISFTCEIKNNRGGGNTTRPYYSLCRNYFAIFKLDTMFCSSYYSTIKDNFYSTFAQAFQKVIGIAITKAPTRPPITIKSTSLLNEKSILASWLRIFCCWPTCQFNFISCLPCYYDSRRI